MNRRTIVIIAAVASENRCIGKAMGMPWHLPEDLKRFKRLTMGHPLIMGRRTFTVILRDFGKPLPGRRTLVLTRQKALSGYHGVELYPSLTAALEATSKDDHVFIAGGAEVYREALRISDRLELTIVEGFYEGDTFFPPYDHLLGTEFELVAEDPREGYSFMTWQRKGL